MSYSTVADCKTSRELFELWQEAHIEEEGNDTIPKKDGLPLIAKHNFIADGCLNPNSETAEYLYILKESNQSKQLDCGVGIHYGALEWRRSGTSLAKRQNTKMLKLFSELERTDISPLNLAVININKRGGYSFCDEEAMKAYGRKYAAFIRRQIEIISPSKVICANTTFDIVARIYGVPVDEQTLRFEIEGVEFLRWFHPRAAKSYDEFKTRFL
ncbi:MAG: hypothetical protein IKB93_14855 [Clostridia bacterium]|nr:hypothetical protein [Clostridia bacterium]